MKSLNENFSDVFDSSLIDYSSDFEHSDIIYQRKLNLINWLNEHDSFTTHEENDDVITYDKELDKFIVDIHGDFDLTDIEDENIPRDLQFGRIYGNFYASNCGFTTFKDKGLPRCVDDDCDLRDNLVFTEEGSHSLEGIPKKIGGDLTLCSLGWSLWEKSEGDSESKWEYYTDFVKMINLNIDLFEQVKKYSKVFGKIVLSDYDSDYGEEEFNWSSYTKPTSCVWYNSLDDIIYHLYEVKHNTEYKLSEIEEFGNQNMSESFNNVFDSSLVDYSNDFEENDIKYKNQILVQNYLKSDNIHFTVDTERNIDLDEEQFKEKIEIITSDGDYPYIDINGDFRITYIQGYELPEYIHFRNVFGTFDAANIQLKSFRGFPKYIDGDCDLSENKGFSENNNSLEGLPENIEGDLDLTHLGWCDENEPDWAEHGIIDAENCYYENLFLLKEIKEHVKHCSGTIQLGYEESVPYAYFSLDELDDIIIAAEEKWNEKGWLKEAVEYDLWQEDEDWDEDCTKWVQEHWPELEFTGEKEDDEDDEDYDDIDESFNNVFDSSLIDYHEDFEKQDKEYIETLKKEKGYISDDEYNKVLKVFKDFIDIDKSKLKTFKPKNPNNRCPLNTIQLVFNREKFENATGITKSSMFYKKDRFLKIDDKLYATTKFFKKVTDLPGDFVGKKIWKGVKDNNTTYTGDTDGIIIYDNITIQISRSRETRPYFKVRNIHHLADGIHSDPTNGGTHVGSKNNGLTLDDAINLILKRLYRVIKFPYEWCPKEHINTY